MKFASFVVDGRPSWGIVEAGAVRDVGAVLGGQYATLKDVIAAEALDKAAGWAADAAAIALDKVEWLPLIGNPGKVFCVGHNYEDHRKETGRAKVGHPSIFTRFADSLTAHNGPIVRPQSSTSLDYEAELAIVIGKGGRHIAEADALGHVAGYACANDGSVRDWQWHTQQFTPGKNFPSTGALGPYLVTPDEIADLDAITVESRLNGRVMQHASLKDLIFPLGNIIAYLSAWTPLSPGDVILTGTPGGVGAKREPPVWMKAGDTIEVEISGVGLLVNTIVDEVR